MKLARRRKGWLLAGGVALLLICWAIWAESKPETGPTPSFLGEFKAKATLMNTYRLADQSGSWVQCTYSIQAPATDVLKTLKSVGHFEVAGYFFPYGTKHRLSNGYPIELHCINSATEISIAPARVVIDHGKSSEKLSAQGWCTVAVSWRRSLSPLEKAMDFVHIPWRKGKYHEVPLLYIKDRTSKMREQWNKLNPADQIDDEPRDR